MNERTDIIIQRRTDRQIDNLCSLIPVLPDSCRPVDNETESRSTSGIHSVSFLASAAVPLQWSANSAERIGHFLHFDIAGWQFQKKKSPQIFVPCSAFETF